MIPLGTHQQDCIFLPARKEKNNTPPRLTSSLKVVARAAREHTHTHKGNIVEHLMHQDNRSMSIFGPSSHVPPRGLQSSPSAGSSCQALEPLRVTELNSRPFKHATSCSDRFQTTCIIICAVLCWAYLDKQSAWIIPDSSPFGIFWVMQ